MFHLCISALFLSTRNLILFKIYLSVFRIIEHVPIFHRGVHSYIYCLKVKVRLFLFFLSKWRIQFEAEDDRLFSIGLCVATLSLSVTQTSDRQATRNFPDSIRNGNGPTDVKGRQFSAFLLMRNIFRNSVKLTPDFLKPYRFGGSKKQLVRQKIIVALVLQKVNPCLRTVYTVSLSTISHVQHKTCSLISLWN